MGYAGHVVRRVEDKWGKKFWIGHQRKEKEV